MSLVNNSLSDSMLASILESSYLGRHPLKAISISRNEFGPECARLIEDFNLNHEKMSLIEDDYTFEELRLHCIKTLPSTINTLLGVLACKGSNLRILTLSKCKLNDPSATIIS